MEYEYYVQTSKIQHHMSLFPFLFVFSERRSEVIVRFVDIGGIVEHHCLYSHFLMIVLWSVKTTLWTLKSIWISYIDFKTKHKYCQFRQYFSQYIFFRNQSCGEYGSCFKIRCITWNQSILVSSDIDMRITNGQVNM